MPVSGKRTVVLLLVISMSLSTFGGFWGGVEEASEVGRTSTIAPLEEPKPEVEHLLRGVGGHFVENRGQVSNPDVQYYAKGEPLSMGIAPWGVVFTLHDLNSDLIAFHLRFEGCNIVEPVGRSSLVCKNHYLIGNDPAGWVVDALTFGEIFYKDIYDGIDLRFHFKDGMLKYDFILGEGADPGSIVLAYDGIEGLRIDPVNGDLLILTQFEDVRDARPVVFLDASSAENGIASNYRLLDDRTVCYDLPEPIPKVGPMVIDPGLLFSTYIHGSGEDVADGIDFDNEGNIVIAGSTRSDDFPTTPGSYAEEYLGDQIDGFIAKFDPTLSSLLFSTFVGSSEIDQIESMDVAPDGSIYAAGMTGSSEFPVTDDAFCAEKPGGWDGFLVKLDSNGSDLLYGSYFGGGGGAEKIRRVVVHEDGTVFLTGTTGHSRFPSTQGAFCTTVNGGLDTFVIRLYSNCSEMMYGTFLGGTGWDEPWEIEVDASGNAYVVGRTESPDFPVTGGAYCTTIPSEERSGFITKINPTGSDLIYSTFLGGTNAATEFPMTECSGVAVGEDGTTYVCGKTNTDDFPTTTGAVQATLGSRNDSIFIVLDNRGSKLLYSTYFGGDIGSDGMAFTVVLDDEAGCVFISGFTKSLDLPTTAGAFDATFRGAKDYYIAGFNVSNYRVEYCTYLGGNDIDGPIGVHGDHMNLCVYGDGSLLISSITRSIDIPVTHGAFDNSFDGNSESVYVARIEPRPPELVPPTGLRAETEIGTVKLTWDFTGFVRTLTHSIYWGLSPDDMSLIDKSAPEMNTYFHDQPFNGTMNYYRISMKVGAQEGPLSDFVSARPYGIPTSPVNLTAATGNGTVLLNWSEPLGTGGTTLQYRVYKGPTRKELEPIGTVGGTRFLDTDVEVGEFVYYAVQAFNPYGDSPLSAAVRIKPLDLPSMPPGFFVTPGDGEVTLGWDMPPRDGGTMLIGFYVWRMTGTGPMEIMATLDLSHLSFKDTNVTNGQSYTYMVSAYSEVGEGRTTTAVDAIPFGLPGKVMEIAANGGVGNVTLEWDHPADDGGSRIKGYIIHWGTSAGDLDREQALGNTTIFTHKGLTNGQTYHYQVAAENAAGLGPVSIVVHATPMGLPGPVRDLKAVAVPSGVRLSWTAPEETGGVEGLTYRVLRGTDPDPRDLLIELVDTFEHLDNSVVRGTTYHYRVIAVSTVGEGAPGPVIQVTAAEAPSQVTDVQVSVGNARVDLSWTAPDDGGSPITQYVVLRGIFQDSLTELVRVTTLNHTDTDVENGKTYHYQVHAVSAVGGGARSEVLSVKPLGPPGAPGVLTAKAEDGKIRLTWATPTTGNTAEVTGYKVYQGDSEYELELLIELGPVTSYVDEDIKENRQYYYKVVATSESGDSDMSRLAKGKVVSEEEPGFAGIAAVLALASMLVLGHRSRRRR